MKFELPESPKKSSLPESHEALEDEYKKYQKGLGITFEDLKGKQVVDIGCGESALFVRSALEHGLNNVTGVDMSFTQETLADEKLRSHLVQVKVENLPFRDVDLIVSYAAIATYPGIDRPRAFGSMASAIKPGGEIRIYPIPKSETLEGIQRNRESIMAALLGLSADDFDMQFIPVEEKTTPDQQTYTNERLIIRKKIKSEF